MKRRLVDINRDCARILTLQRLSWQINFPERRFSEGAFRASLGSGVLRAQVYVYEIDREIVGWLWLDLSGPDSGHIRQIQVEKARWGEGLGRRIVQDAMRLCLRTGKNRKSMMAGCR